MTRKRETAGKANQATHFRSIQTERSHDSFQSPSPHERKHDMTVPPSRPRETDRQTGRDRQRQRDRDRNRQAETDANRQIHRETRIERDTHTERHRHRYTHRARDRH